MPDKNSKKSTNAKAKKNKNGKIEEPDRIDSLLDAGSQSTR